MSRIAKIPVTVPAGVEVTVSAARDRGQGAAGHADAAALGLDVVVEREGDKVQVKAADESQQAGAMSGTLRALLANMVHGVTKGFEKKLQLVGVGYRAQAQGDTLNLTLGFSHRSCTRCRRASRSRRRPRPRS